MSENQRQFPRTEVRVEVQLSFLEDSARIVMTHDISQGGLCMQLNNPDYYTMGEMVSLRFKNPLEDFEETSKDGIIVRHTDDGIAVAFIEMEEF